MPYARFSFCFLIGVILGLIFPFLATWWILAGILVVLVVNEIVGQWGFGTHWIDYRFPSYLLYTGAFVCLGVGIFLGSGHVGRLLIALGKLIS